VIISIKHDIVWLHYMREIIWRTNSFRVGVSTSHSFDRQNHKANKYEEIASVPTGYHKYHSYHMISYVFIIWNQDLSIDSSLITVLSKFQYRMIWCEFFRDLYITTINIKKSMYKLFRTKMRIKFMNLNKWNTSSTWHHQISELSERMCRNYRDLLRDFIETPNTTQLFIQFIIAWYKTVLSGITSYYHIMYDTTANSVYVLLLVICRRNIKTMPFTKLKFHQNKIHHNKIHQNKIHQNKIHQNILHQIKISPK